MEKFSRTADYAFGVNQTLVTALGCALNSLSFVYFATRKTRNENSEFFKRLYMVITFNDFWVCAAAFPVIEAAFSPNRDGLLSSSAAFCTIWTVVMSSLFEMSIFLIGMLSVSRLIVLKFPSHNFSPFSAYLVPAVGGP